jgi:hypothetical protein
MIPPFATTKAVPSTCAALVLILIKLELTVALAKIDASPSRILNAFADTVVSPLTDPENSNILVPNIDTEAMPSIAAEPNVGITSPSAYPNSQYSVKTYKLIN